MFEISFFPSFFFAVFTGLPDASLQKGEGRDGTDLPSTLSVEKCIGGLRFSGDCNENGSEREGGEDEVFEISFLSLSLFFCRTGLPDAS